MKSFEVEVTCHGGGKAHKHKIVVETGQSPVFNASKPAKVRLQYKCPVTAQELIATFTPPVGASRPFTVAKVS
jgi:hypothetical protein